MYVHIYIQIDTRAYILYIYKYMPVCPCFDIHTYITVSKQLYNFKTIELYLYGCRVMCVYVYTYTQSTQTTAKQTCM